jgi:hypothetical protein
MTKYIGITETAKIIRAELKAAFPCVRFSVRAKRYSMGSHIDVSWTNGPNTRSVEAITDRFYGTGFDGMTDSSTSHDSDSADIVVPHSLTSQYLTPFVSRSVTMILDLSGRIHKGSVFSFSHTHL